MNALRRHHQLVHLLAGLVLLAGCAPLHQQSQPITPAASGQQAPASIPIGEMEPEFLYLAAQDALRDNQIGLATTLLEALVQKDEAAIEPHLQLVELLLEQRRFDAAASHIDQLSAARLSDEQHQRLTLLQARLAIARRATNKALQLLDHFLARHPDHLDAVMLRVQILMQENRLSEAMQTIQKAIRRNDHPQLRLMQAQILLQQRRIEEARQSLQRLRKLAPDDETPVLMLSELAIQQKQMDEAESLLRDFLETHPNALQVSNMLGRLLVQQNRLAEAIIIYRDLLQRTGGEPSVLQALGLLYFQHQDYKQAADTFRDLLKIQPSDEASFYLAASLEALKQNREARKLYTRIGDTSPLYDRAQMRLAVLDAADGRLEKAARRLLRVIDKHPQQLMAYGLLSNIRIAQKKYRKLLDETQNLMAIDNLPAQILFNRAIAFDHFKQYDQVEAMLKRLLEEHPRHAEALNFLAYTYAVQGIRLEEAMALVKRALAQKPDDGYYLDTLAWIQYKMGRYKEALATQRKAVANIEDDPVMREHLGDILWKNGLFDAARQQWREAIRLKHQDPALLERKILKGLE